jgi:hypothetical protein
MTDTDALIVRQLRELMTVRDTVEPEEALRRAAERQRSSPQLRPPLARLRRPGRLLRAAIVMSVVVLAVVLVVVVRSGQHVPPAPTTPTLAHSVVVFDPCCGGVLEPSSPHAFALNASSGVALALPDPPGGIEDYALTAAGSVIFAVRRTDRDKAGLTGPAYVFPVGSTVLTSLGLATDAYVGSVPGSVWLLAENSVTSHHVPTATHCTLRLVSANGGLLVPAATIPCSWDVWGGVKQGVVIGEGPSGFKVWTPPGWPTSNVSFNVYQPWSIITGGSTVALFGVESVCPCQLTLVDSGTGRQQTLQLPLPPSYSLVQHAELASPDGNLVAFVAVPQNLPDQPTIPPGITGISCGGCFPEIRPVVVTGRLVVVDASTGKVAFSRSVPVFVSGADIPVVPAAISGDGNFVFLPASRGAIEAVPTYSPTAPLRNTEIPPVQAKLGFFEEDMVAAVVTTTSATGTVSGQIIQVGGPAGAPNRAVRGVVTLTDVSSGAKYQVSSGPPGGYSVTVPAGSYDVSGISLDDSSDGHPMGAIGKSPVVVVAGRTVHVDLYVQIR